MIIFVKRDLKPKAFLSPWSQRNEIQTVHINFIHLHDSMKIYLLRISFQPIMVHHNDNNLLISV